MSEQLILPPAKLGKSTRIQAGRSLDGGFYIELIGDAGLTLMAEMSPQQTIEMAVAMLKQNGIVLRVDPKGFAG